MKPKLLILAVVVGASVGLWQAVQEWQAKRHPNLATTEQFISFACDRALEDAQIHDHIALDYGVASLKQVDEILGRVHAEYVQNPGSVSVPGMSAEYGAYVGEVIRRSEPNAYWTRDSQVAGEKAYPLHWKTGESYPMGWCAKRIINGDEDSIWVKYTVLKDDRSQQKRTLAVHRSKEAQK